MEGWDGPASLCAMVVNGRWHCVIHHPSFYLPFPPIPFLLYSSSPKSHRINIHGVSPLIKHLVKPSTGLLARLSAVSKGWDIVHNTFWTHSFRHRDRIDSVLISGQGEELWAVWKHFCRSPDRWPLGVIWSYGLHYCSVDTDTSP